MTAPIILSAPINPVATTTYVLQDFIEGTWTDSMLTWSARTEAENKAEAIKWAKNYKRSCPEFNYRVIKRTTTITNDTVINL
jgi:hypothetical protein